MSFFDKSYQTPAWFIEKNLDNKLSRRQLLKLAAGATAIAAFPSRVFSSNFNADILTTDPWQTLHSVLNHLLPSSDSGPSATDIQATQYLYNVVNLQPIETAESEFIFNGVGWLNDFSEGKYSKKFNALNVNDKESALRTISQSRAGYNWLNTLLNYIFEAMLSPPVYGGNPNGIGWTWLEHQAGFPLPDKGHRFYELPGTRYTRGKTIPVANIDAIAEKNTPTTEDKRKS